MLEQQASRSLLLSNRNMFKDSKIFLKESQSFKKNAVFESNVQRTLNLVCFEDTQFE